MKLRFLIPILLALAPAAFAQNTPAQRVIYVTADPAGACSIAAALRYNTSNGNLWGCDNGTWATVAAGGSMTWPTTPGVTVCSGTPCTAWGTSLTAPTGPLVGTTDTQALTNKTVDGVTPTTFGFLDPTSSVQTQLNGKAASNAATTVNGQTCTLGSTCTIALSAINPQTATYQVLAADFSNYKTITAASGTFTVTLVASGSQPANGQYITVINYGSGVVTIARSGQNINGGTSSITLAAASATAPTSAKVYSDGSNYFATTAGGSTGGGGSNITSGTYSSLPGTCAHSGTASDAYWTTDSYYSFLCTATNTFSPFLDGKQATLPTAASTWTAVSGASGTAAKADSAGAVTLSTTASVIGIEAILKATPAAPYTKTIAVRHQSYLGTGGAGNGDINGCGVLWTNGTTTSSSVQYERFETAGNIVPYWYLVVAHATNFTYTSVGTDTLFPGPLLTGGTIWYQLIDDNTNRTMKISMDGINFRTIYGPTARTSPFTPTNYGVWCGAQGGVTTAATPWQLTLLSDN